MPQLPGFFGTHRFSEGKIVGQEAAGASQRQIYRNLSIPLSTVNRVITQFKNKAKETVEVRSGRPGSSTRYLRSLHRSVEREPRVSAVDVTGDAIKCVISQKIPWKTWVQR